MSFIQFHASKLPALESLCYIIIDDDNRILLKSIPEASDCQGDYINACYIDVSTE